MSSKARARRSAPVALVLLVTLVLAFMTPGTAPAQASFGSYSVSARSDLFQVQVFDDRIPIFPEGQAEVELSPATTQAVVDSLGSSRAFASAPYPGESVAGLPGLIGGLAEGNLPPLPRYPVLVSSDFPTQESDEVDQGVYLLRSDSSQLASRSRAQFGGGTGEGFGALTGEAISEVEATDRTVTAVGQAQFTGLQIPDVLDIGSFTSSASITIEAGAEPVAETSFDAPLITVAGVGLKIGPDGVTLADSVLPFDLMPLADLLAGAGVDLEVLPAETGTTEGGSTFARSAGLLVTAVVVGPDGNEDTLRLELGRAFATADARPVPAMDVPPPAGPDPTVPEAAGPVATSGSDGTGTGVGTPPAPVAAPAPPIVADGTTDVAPPAVAEPAPPAPTPATVAAGPIDAGPSLAGLYAMLVAAAAVALGSGRLFGLLGVRLGLTASSNP